MLEDLVMYLIGKFERERNEMFQLRLVRSLYQEKLINKIKMCVEAENNFS